ncbi:DNA-binding transcriptional regulator, XRE-family HTH domain [Anaerovibrio lipolyticus DSM 3074]|uniref:DNA-binding transcriptional regulator, XRE-family HTH domain n=1 Tax=Anaerovibrio lipolyticus DSM 3074 TaxID=1120997 RepID=A0A1M5ZXM7_9FIRM|nr:helix-turn-helix transcriptional regulator [Anaerovibrio lipolyticus]SHI28779.1 DNA-binding transcriptional regulator, XRE-family HTH domain [Anaerovibrio lipolyticus DSM 3074]
MKNRKVNSVIPGRLRILRNSKKMQQADIAKILDVSTTCYAQYERGERDLPLDVAGKLCKLYGCDISVIMTLPIISEVIVPNNLIINAQEVINNAHITGDWQIDSETFKKIDDAMAPIFKAREEAFNISDIPTDILKDITPITIKTVRLNNDVEQLINTYLRLNREALNKGPIEQK